MMVVVRHGVVRKRHACTCSRNGRAVSRARNEGRSSGRAHHGRMMDVVRLLLGLMLLSMLKPASFLRSIGIVHHRVGDLINKVVINAQVDSFSKI